MKYLRKFNEGLTIDEVRELTYDIEDILIEVDDLNIKEDVDYDYEIKMVLPERLIYLLLLVKKI